MVVYEIPKRTGELPNTKFVVGLAVSHIVFGIGFWATIQLATFIFLGVMPLQSWFILEWNLLDPFWLGNLKYGLRLYVTMIPLLAIMGINMGVFVWFFEGNVQLQMKLLKTIGLSVCLGLPLIVLFYVSLQGFWVIGLLRYLPYPSIYLTYIGIFYSVFVVYLSALVVFSAPYPMGIANKILRNPVFWILFSGFFVILIITLIPFVDSLITESWQYLPADVYLSIWMAGITMSSLPVAFVLPVFPLLFSSLGYYTRLVNLKSFV